MQQHKDEVLNLDAKLHQRVVMAEFVLFSKHVGSKMGNKFASFIIIVQLLPTAASIWL